MNWTDNKWLERSPREEGSFGRVFAIRNRKRILNAFLDTVLLIELSQRNAMKASHVIDHLKSKYEVELSPGTIYPVLRTLEKSGDIAAVRSRKVKTYMITGKGLQRVLLFRDSFVDLEDTFSEALGEEYWAAVNEVSKCGKNAFCKHLKFFGCRGF